MTFTERLRDEIEYRGISQKELAERAGIKKRAFDMYVGLQESMPPADVAVRIAQTLGISVEYLVTGKEVNRTETLSADDRKLLEVFRNLDSRDRSVVIKLAQILSERDEQSSPGNQRGYGGPVVKTPDTGPADKTGLFCFECGILIR